MIKHHHPILIIIIILILFIFIFIIIRMQVLTVVLSVVLTALMRSNESNLFKVQDIHKDTQLVVWHLT